jgi:hypothetical protein
MLSACRASAANSLAICGLNIHFCCDVARFGGSACTYSDLPQLALTSRYHPDKNANFLRQAVSFASRNGRSQ